MRLSGGTACGSARARCCASWQAPSVPWSETSDVVPNGATRRNARARRRAVQRKPSKSNDDDNNDAQR
ncbi:unnamed protein product [Lampetra planeri]